MKLQKFRQTGSEGGSRLPSVDTLAEAEDGQGDSDSEKRMFYPKNGRRTLKKDFTLRSSSGRAVAIGLVFTLCLLIVKYLDTKLPEVRMAKDLVGQGLQFSEERARNDLISLTSVGPRIAGSYANDITTVANLLAKLQTIKAAMNISGDLTLEFEEQRPTGGFFMDWDEGQMSLYAGIPNVVARLRPRSGWTEDTPGVLFNCHFDTKPASPGATDDVISCAVMLEVIRDLALHPDAAENKLDNSLVFLFNGAEELGLQGAHGFVKGSTAAFQGGHPWSRKLACFVNLEGAGGGGREILFQSGPGNGWILEAYKEVAPHPYGLTLAEEAFQNSLIPSDTDFRIFRDFGNIPGLDMAYTKNGWVYHTKWDRHTEIPAGSIQNMGDNALALARHFGRMDFSEVDKADVKNPDQGVVFFDVFGLFMISYTETVGVILNYIFAVLITFAAAIDVRLSKPKKILKLLWLVGATLLSWGVGIAVSVFVGAFMNWTGYRKPYYSYPLLTLVLYGFPALMAQALTLSFAYKSHWHRAWLGNKFTFGLILFGLSFFSRSAYVFNGQLLFGVASWLLYFLVLRRFRMKRALPFVNFLVSETLPLMYSLYLTITLIDVFVPIQGRSGTESNPNIFLGVVMGALLSVIVFNGVAAHLAAFKKIHLLLALLFGVFVLNPAICRGLIGNVPFQEKTPMRVQVLDIERVWYTQDMRENRTEAGYWFWPVDGETSHFMPYLAATNSRIANFIELDANNHDCEDLYCNMPFFWPTYESIKKTPWVPKSFGLPMELKNKVGIEVLAKDRQGNVTTLQLKLLGPTQMSIAMSPAEGYNLSRWSLGENIQAGKLTYKGQPTYFMYLGKGHETSPEYEITLELTSDKEAIMPSEVAIYVMAAGHFMHENAVNSEEFQSLLDRLPSWTTASYWSAVVKQYAIGA